MPDLGGGFIRTVTAAYPGRAAVATPWPAAHPPRGPARLALEVTPGGLT